MATRRVRGAWNTGFRKVTAKLLETLAPDVFSRLYVTNAMDDARFGASGAY